MDHVVKIHSITLLGSIIQNRFFVNDVRNYLKMPACKHVPPAYTVVFRYVIVEILT